MKHLFAFLFLLGAGLPACSAATWYVNGSGGNDASAGTSWATAFLTLQKAIDAAAGGDEIWMTAGLYRPTKNSSGMATSGPDATFYITKGLIVYGGFNGTEASPVQRPGNLTSILSGDMALNDLNIPALSPADIVGPNARQIVQIVQPAGVVVFDGLTINAGDSPGASGAGLSCVNCPVNSFASNCTFSANRSAVAGGAVSVLQTAAGKNMKFLNCTFSHNSAITGGAATVASSYTGLRLFTAEFVDCTLEYNSAFFGGAINSASGTSGYNGKQLLHTKSCTFAQNQATAGRGAAVLVESSDLFEEGNLYTGNQCSGGAQGIEAIHHGFAHVEQTQFSDNLGTAFWGDEAYVDLLTSLFENNTGGPNGGAIRFKSAKPGADFLSPALRIWESRFHNNSSTSFGGAVGIEDTCYFNCFRSEFIGNTAVTKGGAVYFPINRSNSTPPRDFEFCLFRQNTAHDGGAVWVGSPDIETYGSFFSANQCTFFQNQAIGGNGGAIYDHAGVLTLSRCIAWNNQAADGKPFFCLPGTYGVIDLWDCISQGTDLASTGAQTQVGFLLFQDPLFVSATDQHLQMCSPAIDITDSYFPSTLDLDKNTVPFNNGGSYDCGCYEYQGTPPNTYYRDQDGDGYGVTQFLVHSCAPRPGYVATPGDCYDYDATAHPGAPEICDGLDNDCDNLVDADDPNFQAPPPSVARCRNPTVYLNATGTVSITPAAVDNGSTLNCNAVLNVWPKNFSCSTLGANTVTLTLTEASGAAYTCTAVVTVADNIPPGITCPAPLTVSCAGNIPAPGTAGVSVSDNCSPVLKSHFGDSAPYEQTCTNRFKINRIYKATDSSGNTKTCSQVITVFDNTKPTLSGVPANITVQCSGIPLPANLVAADNCGGTAALTLGQSTTPGACPDSYLLTRLWTATDACGNTQTASQRITVQDTQKPVFVSLPAPVTVECGAIPAPASPVATDNCDASVSITYNNQTVTPGACPDVYTIVRLWTATDNCGNTQTATQKITVRDTQKPVFTSLPPNLTLQCSDPLPGVGTPVATDNCSGPANVVFLGQTTANATCSGSYQVLRTWLATDACGNTTAATQTIYVQDTQAPVFTSVPANLTLQCSDLIPLGPGQATATDNCGGYVQVVFLGQTRTDGNCLYNYTITRVWRALDECGNAATASQVLTIHDTQAPSFNNPPANTTVSCANVPDVPVLTAQDNCGPATVAYLGQTQSPGTCASGYSIFRTWRATDLCGNSAAFTHTITVTLQTVAGPSGGGGAAFVTADAPPAAQAREGASPHLLNASLAPNPALDEVWVAFELETDGAATLQLLDVNGRLLRQEMPVALAGVNRYRLDLAGLAGGVYLVQVLAGGQRATQRLVVGRR